MHLPTPNKTQLLLCVFALVFAGCGDATDTTIEEPASVTLSQEARAVAGDWNIPSSLANKIRNYNVPVVNPPRWRTQGGSCPGTNPFNQCTHPACIAAHPGTSELTNYIFQDKFKGTGIKFSGSFFCRRNSNPSSREFLSVHAIGRAIDITIPYAPGNQANNQLGDQVANWLVENAEIIGIQRVIWDGSFYNGQKGFRFGQLGGNPHRDHIHVELSVDGGAKRTPFFTNGGPTQQCTAQCNGDLVVNKDCSTINCAATKTTCLPGAAPRCSEPEAPKAVRVPGAANPSVTMLGPKSRVNFVTPTRLFDTRQDSLSTQFVRGDGSKSGPLTAEKINTFTGTAAQFPAGTLGGWFNTAVVPLPDGETGFLSIFPDGISQPETSNINYKEGVRANALPMSLTASRKFSIFAFSKVNAIIDMYARFAAQGNGLTTTGPTRIYDTRSLNLPLKPNKVREIEIRNAPPGTTGIVASVAAIHGKGPGFIQIFDCGKPAPSTSNVNFETGNVAANAIVSSMSNNKVCVKSSTEVDMVLDITGFFSPEGKLSYQPIEPVRLLDTREKTSLFTNRLASKQTVELPIQSLPGMPKNVWAVVTNLTAVDADAIGFLTAHPCGAPVPSTSSLNFSPVNATGAVNVTPIGSKGSFCVFAQGRTHLIADVLGVWVHDESTSAKAPVLKDNPDGGEPESPGDVPDPDEDMGSTDGTDMGTTQMDQGNGNMGADLGGQPGKPDQGSVDTPTPGGNATATDEGCSSTGTGTPNASLWLLALLGGFLWRRRRLR